jgi:hypothetical protein
MSALGHLRPIHVAPKSTEDRYSLKADIDRRSFCFCLASLTTSQPRHQIDDAHRVDHRFRPGAVLEISVPLSSWGTTSCTVHPANAITPNCWRKAWFT